MTDDLFSEFTSAKLVNYAKGGQTPLAGCKINIEGFMPNKPGCQLKIKHCPICKSKLKNVPRKQMKSRYRRRDGTVALHTHTYDCLNCGTRFEINQDR